MYSGVTLAGRRWIYGSEWVGADAADGACAPLMLAAIVVIVLLARLFYLRAADL